MVVGSDAQAALLVEVAPGEHDEWDGNVAARLLLKLCGHAVRSNER